jgi:hypothetical protein
MTEQDYCISYFSDWFSNNLIPSMARNKWKTEIIDYKNRQHIIEN